MRAAGISCYLGRPQSLRYVPRAGRTNLDDSSMQPETATPPPEFHERRAYPRASDRGPLAPHTRTMARWMFLGHLWLGVLLSGVLLVVSISGILLNHKQAFGLMPDVAQEASAPFAEALAMAELVAFADAAVPAAAAAGVDRLDVRPRRGTLKVRYRDRVVTEVTVDIHSGAVLDVGERNDVFLEKLHTGEIFGDNWVLLSDAAAIALVLLIISGYWLWLFPRSRM
jgi:uncharacterized iron-regulated membrane protein